jgi:hypothetical protein
MNFEELVRLSDKVFEEFISEWRRFPFSWLQEIDIQVELVQRFRSLLKESNHNLFITAKHSHEPNKSNTFQRVTCEPYLKLPTKSWIHPDIVIWSDVPSSLEINSGKYPINIICEIKYSYEEIDSTGDQKRLIESLDSESHPDLAIQLVLIQKPLKDENVKHKTILSEGKLIIYRIYLTD